MNFIGNVFDVCKERGKTNISVFYISIYIMIKWKKILLLSFFVGIITLSFSYANTDILNNISDDTAPKYVPGVILVKFKENKIDVSSRVGISQIKTFSANNDVVVQEELPESNIVIMKTDTWEDIETQIAELESNSNVEYAEPNYIYDIQSFSEPNDQYFNLQSRYYSKIGWTNAMQMINPIHLVWTGLIVAIIDVGVDYNHPDLVNNMWDGSWCVSDTWIFLGWCEYGYDFIDNDKYPLPATSTHGTHVAGIVGATVDNSIWIAWVNPYAKIMALRAGDRTWLTSDAIIRSINFAKNNGARIINASFWWAGNSDGILEAIQSFQYAWGLFIAAAWNGWINHDSIHNYPCDYAVDNIICVASTNWSDTLSSFSDRSKNYVDIAAPGENILSTAVVINQSTGLFDDFENTWYIFSTRSKEWLVNERWIANKWSSFNNALVTNIGSPYTENNESSVSKSLDLSSTDGAELIFDVGCDTEYSTTTWTDRLVIQFSSDWWSTFVDQFQLDESAIDELNWDSMNSAGTAIYTGFLRDIKGDYLKSWFIVRFKWITNGTDNNHSWCFVDNVNIQKFIPTVPWYAYMNGTSMATPLVAWLVSLARSMRPDLGYGNIKSVILGSGDILPGLSWKVVSGKRINIYNTLLALNPTPKLNQVHITSNNSNTQYSKLGDIITVSLTGNQNLSWVSIKIDGQDAVVTGSNMYREGAIIDTWILPEGPISITIDYQSILGTQGITQTTATDNSMVYVDHSWPNISILNWSGYITWSWIILNVTWSDSNGISQVIINGTTYSWWTYRTSLIPLIPWRNVVTITGMDYAWNISVVLQDIVRVPLTYNISSKVKSSNTAYISFQSDVLWTWYVVYGTWDLSVYQEGDIAIDHLVLLSGLVPNTTYKYKVYSNYDWFTWAFSSEYSFTTPALYDGVDPNVSASWAVYLSGVWAWWIAFTNSWVLSISNTWHIIKIFTHNLKIQTQSESWDGIIHGPIQIPFTWTTPSVDNYIHSPELTFEIWSDLTSLVFSGTTGVIYPTVNLSVGRTYNDKTLKVFRSDNGLSYEYIADCKVVNEICSFMTDRFSTFTILVPNSSGERSWWGGWGWGGGASTTPVCKSNQLVCVWSKYKLKDGEDCTSSKIGSICEMSESVLTGSITGQKEFQITTGTSIWWFDSIGSIFNSPFSNELNQAYIYAYTMWITTKPTIRAAEMTWGLIRSHMAKMMVNYITKTMTGKIADTSRVCDFQDIGQESDEIKSYITLSCQFGIMGVGMKNFNPNQEVTRAQFGTVLSRVLYGDTYNWGYPYYKNHLDILKKNGILTNTDPALEELRWYVMLMLMRSGQ